MIKLIEIYESSQQYVLREIYVSPKHIVSLREDERYKQKLHEGVLPGELDEKHRFTKVTLNKGATGQEIIVVGEPSLIESRLNGDQRELLHG